MELIRPPMGWNSFDCYGPRVTEDAVRANAEYMSENLKDFGWEYIVIDIQWYAYNSSVNMEETGFVPFQRIELDEYARLYPCPQKFPSAAGSDGFSALATYIHSLGLKFGIHMMRGIPRVAAHSHSKLWNTEITADQIANPYSICEWNPDMYGVDPRKPGAQEYYDSVIELYAQWGVDLIKCDDIPDPSDELGRMEAEMIHSAVERLGRDMVVAFSGPASVENYEFYRNNSQMWRVTDGFTDSWDDLREMFDICRNWVGRVSDSGFPDCDSLPIGQIGLGDTHRRTEFTIEESKSIISLWSLCRSPLMVGSELTKLDHDTLQMLTNIGILRLTEVSEGAREAYRDSDVIVWRSVDRYDGAEYVAMFNLSTAQTSICPKPFISNKDGNAIELWRGSEINIKSTEDIPGHGCMVIRVEK